MATQCTQTRMGFNPAGKRQVVADFDGGTLSADGGALLLREADEATGLLRRMAGCFTDHRDPDLIEHSVLDMLRQRVYGLALAYEDLNDHDELSRDPLLATAVGKADVSGKHRVRERDKGRPLAGKSSLHRMEQTRPDASPATRYKKTTLNFEAAERLLVDVFLESCEEPSEEIVLDLDATDIPLHGDQEGRFFHGYYREYCYLPLYIFCGHHLLPAKTQPADQDASLGTVDVLEWMILQIRRRWPRVRIILRADSGFARDKIMDWCEENAVDFVFGLARNDRLARELAQAQDQAKALWLETRKASRVFHDFRYRTLESWSRERRVVGKAEHLDGGANPRYIVSSLSAGKWQARPLYEKFYCARGEMENRIKEQKRLFACRASAATIRANQIRLWMSSLAYILIHTIRRIGLRGTRLARARCDTISIKLLKVAASATMGERGWCVPGTPIRHDACALGTKTHRAPQRRPSHRLGEKCGLGMRSERTCLAREV